MVELSSESKVLLTGSTGMVGSNLKAVLESRISAKLLVPTRSEMNLFSYDEVFAYLKATRPSHVVHCAATVGGIEANRTQNSRFLVENSRVGLNLVEAAKSLQIPNLLNIASSCMYPKDHDGFLLERNLLSGALEPTNEGYALAKILTAKLCEMVCRESSGELNYKTIIPCNLFGPGDKFDEKNAHLLPSIIRKLHEAKQSSDDSVEIWGDGTARREFMYVDDLCDFIESVLSRLSELEDYTNVGLGEDNSVNEFYEVGAKIIGYERGFTHDLGRPVGMMKKLMDSSKARKLGWAPKITLEEGIRKTYAYFLETL